MTEETDAIKESAKALQEVAKTTSKAIGASQQFGGFIARFVSGPLEQGMGIFEDKLKYMRWENQQRLMLRAGQFMSEIGMENPTRPIALKLAIPLFQAASLEDDDYLQDKWAELLVNASNSNSGIVLKREYIDILERLTHLEVKILEIIYRLPFSEMSHKGVSTVGLPGSVRIFEDDEEREDKTEPNEDIRIALSNLARLGCIQITHSIGGGEMFYRLNPTLLGKNLVTACTLKRA